MPTQKLPEAIAKIDAVNATDPTLIEIEGQLRPQELVHAEQRTAWAKKLRGGEISEALLIAVRAQHIQRWAIPRDNYPCDRVGYLQWRKELQRFHAEKTGEILEAVGTRLILSSRCRAWS